MKGKTNNPNGRPKGKPNKVTTELKTWIKNLIEDNREVLEKDLQELEPRDRWAIIEKLMSYTIPKQRSIDANINYENLSDDDLNMIIDKLTEEIK